VVAIEKKFYYFNLISFSMYVFQTEITRSRFRSHSQNN